MRIINNNNIYIEIELINKILKSKKKGLNRIALEEYNLSAKELLDLLKEHGYSRVKNQFLLGGQVGGQSVIQVPETVEDTNLEEDRTISENLLGGTVGRLGDKENFIQLMNNFEVLMKIIDEYKNSNVIPNSNIVVQLPYEDGDYKTSVRVNKKVMNQFRFFCEKNRNFSQKELLSQAILDFMNKHS